MSKDLYVKDGQVTTLPNRIRLADGTTKTDPSTFTDEDLASLGYVEIERPPVANIANNEYVTWNSENNSYVLNYKTSEEIQEELQELKEMMIRDIVTSGNPISTVINVAELNDTVYDNNRMLISILTGALTLLFGEKQGLDLTVPVLTGNNNLIMVNTNTMTDILLTIASHKFVELSDDQQLISEIEESDADTIRTKTPDFNRWRWFTGKTV